MNYRKITAFVAFALFFAALGGCSSAPEAAGDELSFGVASEPATLDPVSAAGTADGRALLLGNVFEGLVKSTPDGDMADNLAASHEISADGTLYTFKIRGGVKFHNGAELTARDFAYSYGVAIENKLSGTDKIAAVRVNADGDFEIELKEPDFFFLPYLTTGVVPDGYADREAKPVGTGPYAITEYVPREKLVYERSDYYRDENAAKIKKITIRFCADTNALVSALRSGAVDMAKLDNSGYKRLGGSADGFDAIYADSNMVQVMALNNERAPFDNPDVRRALCIAVDKDEIIDTVFFGKGVKAGSPLIPGLKAFFNADIADAYPTDPDRARELLAEAGYPGGFEMTITVPSNYTMHVDTAQVIVNQLAKIGVTVNIRLVDWATWLTDVYRGRGFDATIISFDGSLSPQSFLSRYLSDAPNNMCGFKSADFDAVLNAASAARTDEERQRLYKEAQRVISDEAAAVFIQDISYVWTARRGFTGITSYPDNKIDFASIKRG